MKIYILADMEGISGIRLPEQCNKSTDGTYPLEGSNLMMQEINAAVDAAFEAGAKEVVVNDTHEGGGQVQIEKMDQRATYETPGASSLMPSLDDSFSGVILLGHHARAGTLGAFLDHTVDSHEWFECRVNDQVVGEIGIEAAYAGHYNVPVIMVSGDDYTEREAKELLGEVECAVVKYGICRSSAKCLPLSKAHKAVQDAVKTALKSIKKYKPYKPSVPATVQLTVYRSDMADIKAAKPGVERVDARTVRKQVDSLRDICSID